MIPHSIKKKKKKLDFSLCLPTGAANSFLLCLAASCTLGSSGRPHMDLQIGFPIVFMSTSNCPQPPCQTHLTHLNLPTGSVDFIKVWQEDKKLFNFLATQKDNLNQMSGGLVVYETRVQPALKSQFSLLVMPKLPRKASIQPLAHITSLQFLSQISCIDTAPTSRSSLSQLSI